MAIDPGKQLIARWRDGKPSDVALLKTAKVETVWLETPQPGFAAACQAAGITTVDTLDAVKAGLWPGVRSAGRRRSPDGEVTSASSEPWVDSNGYLVACQRAMGKTTLLAYSLGEAATRMVAFETLEIALAEACMMGGNFALEVEDRYLRGLRAGDEKALAAWNKLGRTAGWLKEHAARFGRPAFPAVTAIYDGRGASRELANLLFRRNASPSIVSTPPTPSPQIKVLVAASIATPDERAKATILAHAQAGATVVVDADWWQTPAAKSTKQEVDREFFSLGKGQVVAYRKRIAEPSEFALDVIDLVTHRQRAVRLWNAPAILATAGPGPRDGAIVNLLNYGVSWPEEIQVHVLGTYAKAQVYVPGAMPVSLPVKRRAAMTEVFVPKLERACTIEFR